MKLLMNHPAVDKTATSKTGASLLHMAAHEGNTECIEMALEVTNKEDVNLKGTVII